MEHRSAVHVCSLLLVFVNYAVENCKNIFLHTECGRVVIVKLDIFV